MSLVMLGGGGHAKSCQDIIRSFRDYSISLKGRINIGFWVHDTRKLSPGSLRALAHNHDGFILGVGQVHSPRPRINIVAEVLTAGGNFATLISPHARVSPDVKIGKGTVIMPNASVNAGAEIGEYCIINTGDGDCEVGGRGFIGSNAVLLNQIKVCSDTTVGAGSVVTKNVTEKGGIYVGNPAKLLRPRSNR
jgi:acetyltransferase-like isoleucine patch superfamily enzyme